MIDCPHCGAANREGSKFCGDCGQPLGVAGELACPMCDTPNRPGSTVCTECGARLAPVSVPLTEESPEPLEVGEEGLSLESAGDEETAAEPSEPSEVEQPPDIPEPLPGEPMPPWVKKLEGISPEELPAEEGEEASLAPGELPDWLEVPPEFEGMFTEAAPTAEEEIQRGEIPSWLEVLRPTEEGVGEPAEPGGPVETTGLLKGIKGALAVEPILAIPRRAGPVSPFLPSETAIERAGLFETILREPVRPNAEIARPRGRGMLLASTIRWIIYLIVAMAVAVPMLLGSNWTAGYLRASPPTVAFYDTIENLAPESVVLISHDYNPGVAAEMAPQVEVVLDHLMERQARLINVSLTPEGPRLSQRILDRVAEAHGYVLGEDYVNLGYVVGVEAGPRSVVEGFVSGGGTDFAEGIEDIALIVEFAGAPTYLRLWLEQVQGPYQVPMVAGVSATADPFARPYYRNLARSQLLGMMTGLVGAAEYERHSGYPGVALASMDSQSVVHVSVVLLVLIGNVAYFSGRSKRG